MIKTAIKLIALLVVGVLVYNYFLGTPEEKESAEQIFHEVKDLGKATWDLLKSEKEKLDAGKYDEAIDKIEDVFTSIRGKAESTDYGRDYLDRLEDLERKKEELRRRMEELDRPSSYDPRAAEQQEREKEAVREELRRLYQETETLMHDMEKGS